MNILLPVDGSPLSLEAVHHAIRLVREGLKADFVLANVQERSSLYEVLVVHDAEALRRVALEAGEHAVAKADALLTEAGITHDTEIAVGDPANTLVELAESNACDVIIMGAHGEGASSAALGNVAQSVLRHSPVPVMIVRPPQADESGPEGASEEQTVDSAQ
jgi:nucleotide-binding universal stress UspA family protein